MLQLQFDSVREIEPKAMGQFKVYKEDDQYRRLIKDLWKLIKQRQEDFAGVFDEAVSFVTS